MKKSIILVALLLCFLGTSAALPLQTQTQAPPQACGDEAGVVTSVEQDLSALVDTVKKESQSDFDSKYHDQTCQSRLSICLETTTAVLDCLDKASKDAPKQQMDGIKALQATYTKLKNTLDQDIQGLKNAKGTKAAKALIAGFDFSH